MSSIIPRHYHHAYCCLRSTKLYDKRHELRRPQRIEFESTFRSSAYSHGNLYIADTDNNRILFFASGSTTASRVYGQPDFTTGGVNTGGVSATSLSNPWTLAVDSLDNIYIADTGNNRVITIPPGSTTATQVWGQPNLTTSTTPTKVDPTTVSYPKGVALAQDGGLYIADTGVGRVLYFPSGTTVATRAYGVQSLYALPDIGDGNALRHPEGITVAADSTLYVSDEGNQRIQFYPNGDPTVNRTIGTQPVNPIYPPGFPLDPNILLIPTDVALGADGAIYVADSGNNRIVHYAAPATTPTHLSFCHFPTAFRKGYPFSSQPAVMALDASGRTAFGYNGAVTINVSAGPDTNLQGTTTAQIVGGIAYFNDLSLNTVGTGYTLTATSAGISVVSNTFTVNPAYAKVAFITQPANMVIGRPVTNLAQVAILDEAGNIVNDYFDTPVTFTIHDGTQVVGSTTVPPGNGSNIAFYKNIEQPGTGLYLTATSGSLVPATSQPFNVTLADGSEIQPTADRVYGQDGFMSITNTHYPLSFTDPEGVTHDSNDGLYIADTGENRVLYYPVGSTTPTRVYGQANFVDTQANYGTGTIDRAGPLGLHTPKAVAVAHDGGLYIADHDNNRVLYYAPGDLNPSRVYGQFSFSAIVDVIGSPNPTTQSLVHPSGLAVDADGSLYVADSGNNRILHFPSWHSGDPTAGIMADRVYGQIDFSSAVTTNLSVIGRIALAGNGDLYVPDAGHNRILVYPAGSTTPSQVYGQPDMTSTNPNNGGLSAKSLSFPRAVSVAANGEVFISDGGNNRVLHYPPNSTTADQVYGQPNFTSNNYNLSGVNARSLNVPIGSTLLSDGRLVIADAADNRVVVFLPGSTTATQVFGQPNFTTTNGLRIGANTLSAPQAVAVNTSGGTYVADTGNNRVLYYAPGSLTATRVYGQPNFTTNTANTGGLSATSLSAPTGVAVDSNDTLYIADTTNHRILVYPSGSTTPVSVMGEPDFTTAGAEEYTQPGALAIAHDGGLYVADFYRGVVYYEPLQTQKSKPNLWIPVSLPTCLDCRRCGRKCLYRRYLCRRNLLLPGRQYNRKSLLQ